VYLRIYVNYQQDNWFQLLGLAEFSYNNAEQSSTKKSPFFANYGFHPRIHFSPNPESPVPAAFDMVQELHHLHEEVKNEIILAQKQQKEYYDRHHRPTPEF